MNLLFQIFVHAKRREVGVPDDWSWKEMLTQVERNIGKEMDVVSIKRRQKVRRTLTSEYLNQDKSGKPTST